MRWSDDDEPDRMANCSVETDALANKRISGLVGCCEKSREQERQMRYRGDGIECGTCKNELWVCEKHDSECSCSDRSASCPDCNVGLARGGPDYDVVHASARDTALDVDPSKRAH